MTDIALALIGRLNSQLQVTTLGFPAKMIGALALLAWIATLIPATLRQAAQPMLSLLHTIVGATGR
jgi:flagellar biosynthesis protein FliR